MALLFFYVTLVRLGFMNPREKNLDLTVVILANFQSNINPGSVKVLV
jgi:hypothetical protein